MKRKYVLILVLAVVLVFVSGCDPKYPTGKLKTEPIHSINVGETLKIKLIYPTDGMAVEGWKDQNIDVIKNPEVIAVSGMEITGLKSGTATLKISATTVLAEAAYQSGNKDRVYAVSVKITVK